MSRPSLSLCMIIKNEAEALPRCLASVQDQVDEMIVLDTGSTDESGAIARSFGAQVFSYTWADDFSAARNVSLSYAQGDWILVLDADEILVPEALEALRSQLSRPDLLVINLLRQEVGAAQSPYSLVSRLFRRHPAIQFSRPYHALIDDSVLALQQQEPHWQILTVSDIVIRHEGYQPGAIAARQKFERAQLAMEQYLATHPDDTYDAGKLGALYIEMGHWQQGIALLERGLAQAQQMPCHTDPHNRYELHYHLALAQSRLGQTDAAADHYQQALEQPLLPILKLGAYNNLARLLQAEGFGVAALELYETAIAIDPQFATGYYNLGMLKRQQGDLAGAIAAYETALHLNPDKPEIHQNLGVALLQAGLIERSHQAFDRAIALYAHQSPAQGQQLQQQLLKLGFIPSP